MEQVQQEHIEYIAEYLDDMSWFGLRKSILVNHIKGRLTDAIAAELLTRAHTLENAYMQFPRDPDEFYFYFTVPAEELFTNLSN